MTKMEAMYMEPRFDPGSIEPYENIPKVKVKKPRQKRAKSGVEVNPRAPVKRKGKGAGPGGSLTTNYKRCCCAPGCAHARVNNKQVCSLYAFPNGQPFRNLWIRALEGHASPWYQEKLSSMPLNHLFLCSCHFDKPPDPKSRRPDLKYVVPTMFRPPPPTEDPDHEWAEGDDGTQVPHLQDAAKSALEMPFKDTENIPHALYNELVSSVTRKNPDATTPNTALSPETGFSILRNMITKNIYPVPQSRPGIPSTSQEHNSPQKQPEIFNLNTTPTTSNISPSSNVSGTNSQVAANSSKVNKSDNVWDMDTMQIKQEPLDTYEKGHDGRQNVNNNANIFSPNTIPVTPKSSAAKRSTGKKHAKSDDKQTEPRKKRAYTKRKKKVVDAPVPVEVFHHKNRTPTSGGSGTGSGTGSAVETEDHGFTGLAMKDQVFFDAEYGVWYNADGIIKDYGKDSDISSTVTPNSEEQLNRQMLETPDPVAYQQQTGGINYSDLRKLCELETPDKLVVREGASRRKQKPRKREPQKIIQRIPTPPPVQTELSCLPSGHQPSSVSPAEATKSEKNDMDKNFSSGVEIKQEPLWESKEGKQQSVEEPNVIKQNIDQTDVPDIIQAIPETTCKKQLIIPPDAKNANTGPAPSVNLHQEPAVGPTSALPNSKKLRDILESIVPKSDRPRSSLIEALTCKLTGPRPILSIPRSNTGPASNTTDFTLIKQLITQKNPPILPQIPHHNRIPDLTVPLPVETITTTRPRRSNAGRKLVDIISKLKTNWSDNDSDAVDNADETFDPYNDTSGFFVQGKSDSEGESDFSPYVHSTSSAKTTGTFDITSRSPEQGRNIVRNACDKLEQNVTLKSILSSAPEPKPAATNFYSNKESVIKDLLKKASKSNVKQKIDIAHKEMVGQCEKVKLSEEDRVALIGEASSEVWGSRLRLRDLTKMYDQPDIDMLDDGNQEHTDSKFKSQKPNMSGDTLNFSASSLLQSMLISPSVDSHPYSRNKKSIQSDVAIASAPQKQSTPQPDPEMDCSFSALLKSLVKQREQCSASQTSVCSSTPVVSKPDGTPSVYMDNAELDDVDDANNERFLHMVSQMTQKPNSKPVSHIKKKKVPTATLR